jgi:hypothetical protein
MDNKSAQVKPIGVIPLLLIGALIIVSGLFASVPAFFNEEQRFRNQFYEQPTVFTTYFYWYRANGTSRDPADNPHVTEAWDQKIIDSIAEKDWPKDWPGPTNAADMHISGIHDSISEHPLPETPTYDSNGNAIIPDYAEIQIMENISNWFDWMNPAWHEWEWRGMIRAGVDVLMPVYWWNGLHNYWAHEGLVTMVSTWHSLKDALPGLPTIAMFFDTTCMKQLYCENVTQDPASSYFGNFTDCWENGPGPNLSDPYWREQFWLCIDRFYAVVDKESAYEFKGSNVVWMYGPGWFEDVGETVLDYCKAKYQEKYGRGLLFVGPGGWSKAKVDGVCDWGACCPGPKDVSRTGIPTAAVGPGYYNLGAIAIQPAIYHPRDVTVYKQKWQNIIDQGAAWIHVETWNEFHEGTDICWTQEYGYQWIDATREMADILHSINSYSVWRYVDPVALTIPLVALLGLVALGVKGSKMPLKAE